MEGSLEWKKVLLLCLSFFSLSPPFPSLSLPLSFVSLNLSSFLLFFCSFLSLFLSSFLARGDRERHLLARARGSKRATGNTVGKEEEKQPVVFHPQLRDPRFVPPPLLRRLNFLSSGKKVTWPPLDLQCKQRRSLLSIGRTISGRKIAFINVTASIQKKRNPLRKSA